MEDTENTEVEEITTKDPTTESLLQEMENLKNNSVSKEEYEKLKQDNDILVKSLATNRRAPQESETKEPSKEDIYNRIKERSNKILEGDLTSYEYAVLLTENEDDMAKLGIDPFDNGNGENRELKERNDKVSKLLRETLKDSGGDPVLFSKLMETRTVMDR